MRKTGFTLVELIIVISVTTLIGIILSSVLLQAFKGENKVQVISKVKQNGQLVLDRIVTEVRTANEIICTGGGNPNADTLVIYKDGTYVRYRFFKPILSGSNRTNGYIASDTYTADDFPNLAPTPTPSPQDPTGALNIGCTSSLFSSRTVYLTDRDLVKGISIDSDTGKIFFTDQRAGYNDSVTIKFKAYAGVSSGASYDVTLAEGGILLNTSASVRGKR